MATIISKITAFQIEFQAFMQRQMKEIGFGEDILNKIVQEEITKVKPVTQIETILLASASKAREAASAAPQMIAPVVAPVAAAPQMIAPVVAPVAAPVAAAPPAEQPKKAVVKLSVAAPAFAYEAAGGAGSSPTLTISSYSEAVKSPAQMNMTLTESWGDIAMSAAPLQEAPLQEMAAPPLWRMEAEKEFTTFTKVISKKGPHTYIFYSRSISEIYKSLVSSRNTHREDTLMEWLHELPAERMESWLADDTTCATFKTDSTKTKFTRFTIATIIYAFLPFFVNHNWAKNKLKHLGYCAMPIVGLELSKFKVSLAKYFGLSPEDKPTEGMLREVAMIQAIRKYIMSYIGTLLEANMAVYKIRSIEKDLSGDIKVSFPSEEALEKFSKDMKYDMRKDGYL